MNQSISVGKDVLCHCNKCQLNLAHIIVAMKNDKIHKVQCKTCKSTHVYKDPALAILKKRPTSTNNKKITSNVPVSDIWMQRMADTTKKSKAYSIKEKFDIGDLIDHSSFGPGFVESIIDTNKIQVIFRHEYKTLIHNKQ